MGWVSGTVVYFLTWWTVLFATLPVGVRPDAEGGAGGWRGAPRRPDLGRKAVWTTLLAALVWVGIELLVRSDSLSFRAGWLAMTD